MTLLKHCEEDLTALDQSLTGHKWHCPKCNQHLSSLLLCPQCGERYTQSDVWETLYDETAIKLNHANFKLRELKDILGDWMPE